jgi:geranylgeranyl reductase
VKILIIGGGPAGSIAAKTLAPFYNVTLIHDRPDFDKPCGGGVKYKIFKELNLNEKLIKHRINYVYMIYKNEKVKIDLNGKNLAIVKRKEFDSYLRNEAQNAGAKLIYGRFKTIRNNRAIIRIGNENVPFDYDILIAADGVNSTVRKALNLPKIPSTVTHYAKTGEYKAGTCEFFFDFDTGGEYYAWAFPHGNLTHIGTVSRENFNNLCNRLNISAKPKGYHIPVWNENITVQKENVFFVGDAAGQVMPLTFEGIYYAVKSARILAESIIENRSYKEMWDKRFLKEFRFMKKLEKLNKTKIRALMVKAHKLKFIQNFSIRLWLGENNV